MTNFVKLSKLKWAGKKPTVEGQCMVNLDNVIHMAEDSGSTKLAFSVATESGVHVIKVLEKMDRIVELGKVSKL